MSWESAVGSVEAGKAQDDLYSEPAGGPLKTQKPDVTCSDLHLLCDLGDECTFSDLRSRL